jgi:hypothetical protein
MQREQKQSTRHRHTTFRVKVEHEAYNIHSDQKQSKRHTIFREKQSTTAPDILYSEKQSTRQGDLAFGRPETERTEEAGDIPRHQAEVQVGEQLQL